MTDHPEQGCPFCEVVQRDDPDAREVYRDSHTVAFFPTEPAVLGHTMVIPRAHIANVWELPESLAQQLSVVTLRIATVMRQVMHPDGLNIIQSNGAAATQTVMHLHVHLVPRWVGDRMGDFWPQPSDYPEPLKDAVWEQLRTALHTVQPS